MFKEENTFVGLEIHTFCSEGLSEYSISSADAENLRDPHCSSSHSLGPDHLLILHLGAGHLPRWTWHGRALAEEIWHRLR